MQKSIYLIRLLIVFSISLMTYSQTQAQANEIDSLEQLIRENIHDTVKFDAIKELYSLYYEKDIDKSIEYANKMLSLSQKAEDDLHIGLAYNLLGRGYYQKDLDLETIINAYNTGIQYAQKAKNTKLESTISNYKGFTYEKFGQKEEALKAYQYSFTLRNEIGDKVGAVRILGNIAGFLKDFNDLEGSKAYYFKAIKYAKENDDELMVSQLGNNLGNIYYLENKIDSAIILFEKAIEVNKAANNQYFTSLALSNLGRIYTDKKQFKLAEDYLLESYETATKIQNKRCLASAVMNLSENYSAQKQYSKAIEMANKGLGILGENGNILYKMDFYEILSKNHELQGNYKLALDNQKIQKIFSDSLYNTDKIKQISSLKIEYEVAQRETENKLLKSEKDNAKKTLRSRTAIAFGLIALLLLLGGYSFFINRTNLQRKRLNERLATKVEERTVELQVANKQLEQANYELRTLNYIASHDIKEPIRNIGNYAGFIRRKLPADLQNSLDKYFEVIKASTSQLYTLVEDFSRYSTISKDASVEMQTVDLNNLVNSLDHSLYESIQGYNGQIVNNGLPNIQSNTSLLYSLLKNLIDNGLKFNTSNVPTIELSYKETATHHIIIVSDNGIGIEKEYQEQVFKMFKRLNNRDEYQGSGIGLAIVKLAIDKLNGTLHLESIVNKGSVFTISLPK